MIQDLRKFQISPIDFKKLNPHWYLLLGIIFMTASHLSFSIDVLAWVSMLPFLLYLKLTKGVKSRLLFVLSLITAWSFIVLKIVTAPIPYALIFMYSIPISLFHLPGYLLWSRYSEHKWSLFLFPVLMSILEWVQYTYTPLGSWGAAAYTQTHSLIMMQMLSLFGMAGLSFIIYWVNVALAETLFKGKLSLTSFHLPLATLIVMIVFGALRFDLGKSGGQETICIAAVGTDSEIGGLPLPPLEDNEKVILDIFERTQKAAHFGAELIVWNEAAFFLLPDYEQKWVDSIQQLASRLNINLVASYVVPISIEPFLYENKLLFIRPNGDIEYSYLKHEPVPGEPAIKGQEALKVSDIDGAKVGAAICYDYDFPYLAQAHGNLDADIVAIPSSDWRGIDPLHTRMAAFRAVEQGHSVVRSTRFGLSAAISPYGEMRSQASSFDQNSKIMVSELPKQSIFTLYSVIGDTFVYLCIALLIFLLFRFNYNKG